MDETCNIEEPKSLKELLEFFSKLHEDAGTVTKLQTELDNDYEVKTALEALRSNGLALSTFLQNVDKLYKELVTTPGYGQYGSVGFSNGCGTDELLNRIHVNLPKLYSALLFLYRHIDKPWDFGLDDWKSQKIGDGMSDLSKWLTDKDVSKYTGLKLVPGGFTKEELQPSKAGLQLTNELNFMDPWAPKFMSALFLINPWEPPRVGDKVAFVRGFCKKLEDGDFKKKFEKKVEEKYPGVNSEEVKTTSQNVLNHLTKGFQEIKDNGDVDAGLTPINDVIYKQLSHKHVEIYFKFLDDGITGFVSELAQMKTAMGGWEKSGKDPDQSQSRFYYGFRGSAKDDQDKKNIQSAIEELTGLNGSLQQLSTALTPQQDDEDDDEDNPNSQHSSQTASDSSSSAGITGGLLGTTALLGGGGGGAYALNLFGFGDFMRSLFRGPGIANLRG